MDIETVTIANAAAPSGKTTINKCDFDPAKHKLLEDAPAITPEAIGEMKRADVIELLEAHGYVNHKGKKLAEVRSILSKIMFMGDI